MSTLLEQVAAEAKKEAQVLDPESDPSRNLATMGGNASDYDDWPDSKLAMDRSDPSKSIPAGSDDDDDESQAQEGSKQEQTDKPENEEPAKEKQAESEPENSKDEATESFKLDEDVIARALLLNIKPEEMQGYADAGLDVGKILDNVEAHRASNESQNSTQQEQSQQKADSEQVDFDNLLKLKFDESEYDADFVNELNKQVNEQLGPVIKQLTESNKSLLQQNQTFQRQQTEAEIDGLIGSLPKEYADAKKSLGESYKTLKPGSPEAEQRMKVVQVMANLQVAHSGKHQTLDSLFNQAIDIVFPEAQKQATLSNAREKLKTREKSFLSRPNNAQEKKTPEQSAISSLSAKMAEYGMHPGEGEAVNFL